jgi:hypothetical protein
MIADILGELGSAPVWLYRAWGFIFFKSYRESVRVEYQKMSTVFRWLDFSFSTIFFLAELALIAYMVGLV